MPPQLFNFNGQPTLDSREVAKMIGKSHKHLMRDIRQYISNMTPGPSLDPAQFFIESNYKDANGQFRPCYLLTKQGCEFVGNKLTGKKGTLFTVQYVGLFNDYEKRLVARPQFQIPQNMAEALQLAADQAKKLMEQQPKVDYFDTQMHNPGLMTVTEIAKDYGMTAAKFNKLLHKFGIQFKQGKHWSFTTSMTARATHSTNRLPTTKTRVFTIISSGHNAVVSLSTTVLRSTVSCQCLNNRNYYRRWM